MRDVGHNYMTLLLNCELISRVKLCLMISVIPDIVKDCPKIRNLPMIFLRSFENVSPATYISAGVSGQTTAVYYSQGCRGYGDSHGYGYGMGMGTVMNPHGFGG